MALTKSGFKTNLVSFWRQNRRRRGEEEKREEEKRKREKKKREKKRRGRREEEEGGTKIKGMELLTLGMDHMDFVRNSRKDYEFQT